MQIFNDMSFSKIAHRFANLRADETRKLIIGHEPWIRANSRIDSRRPIRQYT